MKMTTMMVTMTTKCAYVICKCFFLSPLCNAGFMLLVFSSLTCRLQVFVRRISGWVCGRRSNRRLENTAC
jgi:hypothetical protein